MPFFSIIIPVYNKEKDLPHCIESVLMQDFPDWEIVIVNDGSADKSSDVAKEFAKRDERITVVDKEQNEGTHRARKSGVQKAKGKYLLFLDPDDKISINALSEISKAINDSGCPELDIVHYGMKLFGTKEVSNAICDDVERYGNTAFPILKGKSICDAAYLGYNGKQQDWRVVQRVFLSELCKKAFSLMTNDRLGRGQDSYEYFVVSTLAKTQLTRNDLIGYEYYFGDGVTSFNRISVSKFLDIAQQFQACIGAVKHWSNKFKGFSTSEHFENYNIDMLNLLMIDWDIRLNDPEKLEAATEVSKIIGRNETAVQLARLARDKAYGIWVGEFEEKCLDNVVSWIALSEELFDTSLGNYSVDYHEFYDAALGHVVDISDRMLINKGHQGRIDSIITKVKDVLHF